MTGQFNKASVSNINWNLGGRKGRNTPGRPIAGLMTMKTFDAKCLTSVCSGLIHLLHNRKIFSFNRLELQSVQFSFSQFGEDLAICRIVEQLGLKKGTYVDAAAYHPIFGSNTLLLYKQGWRGINIDLDADRIAQFVIFVRKITMWSLASATS